MNMSFMDFAAVIICGISLLVIFIFILYITTGWKK
jgi:hypothetical protein